MLAGKLPTTTFGQMKFGSAKGISRQMPGTGEEFFIAQGTLRRMVSDNPA